MERNDTMDNEKDLKQDIIIKYIKENFHVLGEASQMEYVTSADIIRELSEMVTLSIADVTSLMDQAGFKIEFVEGKPYWIVYRT